MREIKFRAIDDYKKKFVYGYYAKTVAMTHITDCIITVGNGMVLRQEIDIKTLGQFTGLQDKNGVDIYEGDKVLLNGKKGTIIIDEKGTGITWQDSQYVKISDYLYKMCDMYNFDIEVIGNIHEEDTK